MTDLSGSSDGRGPVSEPPRRTVLRAAGGVGLLGAAAALAGRSVGFAGSEEGTDSAQVKAALLAGAVCDLTPESDEGPFYLPDELVRDDIREDHDGVLLRLRFHVMNANTCKPLRGAAVDI